MGGRGGAAVVPLVFWVVGVLGVLGFVTGSVGMERWMLAVTSVYLIAVSFLSLLIEFALVPALLRKGKRTTAAKWRITTRRVGPSMLGVAVVGIYQYLPPIAVALYIILGTIALLWGAMAFLRRSRNAPTVLNFGIEPPDNNTPGAA